MSFTILVTGRNLNVIGDPITRWTNLDITLKFNEPDVATLTVPTDGLSVAQLAPGNRLVVMRDPAPALGYPGEVVIAGPIEQPGAQKWSIDGADTGSGTTTIACASDLASIVAEVAYPDPAHAITAQATGRRTFAATKAETMMRQLVSENVGPSAIAARRIPGLTLAADGGRGASVTAGFRLDPLGDALRSVALAGGGLGFRTRQATVGASVVFEVYQPRDLRGQVRFSRGLSNLLSYSYTPAAPTATVAIVGAQGEGVDRNFTEVVSAAASTWGRMVTLVDRRDTDDPTETTQGRRRSPHGGRGVGAARNGHRRHPDAALRRALRPGRSGVDRAEHGRSRRGHRSRREHHRYADLGRACHRRHRHPERQHRPGLGPVAAPDFAPALALGGCLSWHRSPP
ncbi:hypothetical protein [Micromonospora sp. WMMD980]|uniref:Gp37-like protein n=1 Tax=Micromonospora sp. WMMD980 TaxID=3016088 RepID=UPI0024166353|nr:hypothetical protein [Micromonospora sp. WMMD980]MDG4801726.1 hypothetical protein [Micromonospora sp. WMMD980]